MATLKYYNPNLDAWTSSSGNVLLGSDIPIGVVLQFSGKDTMIPDGFLICDGSSLLRTDYPDLFNVIGTTYGSTDNTHFNLPNIKGKTIVSLDSNDNDFNKLGKTVGEKTPSLTKNELPSMDVYMTKDTWFDRGGLEAGGAANRRVVAGGATGGDTSYIIGTVNGGNQPHNNIQPSFVQYTIIKAKKTSYTASKVIDNLNSDSNTNALSANQGKVLNEKINKLVKTYALASDANSYVKYNNLKVETRDTPSPYSDYGCGSTRITSSTENLANTEQLYNEMVSFNSKNVRKELVDKKNCIVFTNASYRATFGFKGLQGRYKKNTQYVVRFKARCYDTSISGSSALFIQAYNKNGDLIGSDSHNAHGATWMQFSFVTNVNSSLDYIDFSYGKQTEWCIDLDSFEIYAGTSVKAVDKNEDTDVVIQFNKGQKLMEGDYLAEDGIHRTKTQIVLDGVTDGLKVSNVTKHSNDIYYCVVNLVKQSLNNTDDVNGLYCSHFMPRYGVELGNCYIAGSGLFLVLVLTDQTITTTDAANEWLAMQKEANIPVVVEYKLAKEIIEPHKNILPLWIDQYKNQTNIYTSDESEVEVETTSNESLANIQREIKSLYDKPKALNTNTNSTTDAYSCDYINKRLFGIVLFENSAGDNTGSITLNDSITKYPEVKIDYVIAVGDYITHESKRVSITSGHVIELSSVIAHSATIQLVHTGRYLFKDKAVTRVVETRSRITSAANVGWDGTSSGIYITKITGFIQ